GIQFFPTRTSVYDLGCRTLENFHWQRLRIFAPVGLWEKNEQKGGWLSAVAKSAAEKRVGSIWGVFGLPPVQRSGKSRPVDDVVRDLIRSRKALEPLNNISNIYLHFYPPFPASVGS